MTALRLFDALSRPSPGPSQPGRDDPSRLARFAEKLIDSALSDLQRLRDYEQDIDWPDSMDEQYELNLLRSIWRLYDEWAKDAEQLMSRARDLTAAGQTIAGLDRFKDAYARIRARLTLSPEKIARAGRQARRGEVVPAEQLRDGLQARLRA